MLRQEVELVEQDVVEAPRGPTVVVMWWCKRRRNSGSALFAQLQLLGEAHGDNKQLRVVELDVEAKRWPQFDREGLDALCIREGAHTWEQSFKLVLVGHKLPEWVGADWRPKPEV